MAALARDELDRLSQALPDREREVALLLAYSAQSVGKTYNVLSKVEWWARQVTGWIFVLLGVHFSLMYVFEVY